MNPSSSKAICKKIRGLKCPVDKREIYVCLSPELHFYVSVSRQGTKSLLYRRKWKGTYRQINLGSFTGQGDDKLTTERAEESIAQARAKCADYESQDDPFDARDSQRAELTLRALFDEYLKKHAMANKKKTAGEISKNFERWLSPLAEKKLSDISQDVCYKLFEQITENRGEYAANRAVQLGRAVFNKGITWERFSRRNPFTGIKLHDEKSRDRFLSPGEVQKLLKGLEVYALPDLRDFIKLSLFTGARKSNLLSLEWKNVDLEAGRLRIPRTKNNTSQVIPLSSDEIALLQARKDFQEQLLAEGESLSPFVFPGTGKSGHLVDIKNSWTTLREKLDLSDVTIHDLRRSLAAGMANANVNVALIQSALNHKDIKTTMLVYARTSKDAELQAKLQAHSSWREQPEENKIVSIDEANKSERRRVND
jgi:integrase